MRDGQSDLGAVTMTLSEDIGFRIASYVEHLKLPDYLYADFIGELAASLVERRPFSDSEGLYEAYRKGVVAETNAFLEGLRKNKNFVAALESAAFLQDGAIPKRD